MDMLKMSWQLHTKIPWKSEIYETEDHYKHQKDCVELSNRMTIVRLLTNYV